MTGFRKGDLQATAIEVWVQLSPCDTITKIINKIEASPDHNREITINQIRFIRKSRWGKLVKEKKSRKKRIRTWKSTEGRRWKRKRTQIREIKSFTGRGKN